jgi:hypothetical protein
MIIWRLMVGVTFEFHWCWTLMVRPAQPQPGNSNSRSLDIGVRGSWAEGFWL